MLSPVRRLLLLVLSLAATAIAAPTASASFAGRDGDFALQPLTGDGVLIAGPAGQHPHRICSVVCGKVKSPHWSPDGRQLVLGATGGSKIIYADGTCEDCVSPLSSGPPPVFAPTPGLLTAPGPGADADGVDQLFADGQAGDSLDPQGHVLPDDFQLEDSASTASEVAWSSTSELAFVTGGQITAGPIGRLLPHGAGSQPSWSPDGRRLAIRRRGWITIINVRSGAARRIARGSSPAWAPAGGSLAYLAPDHSVRIETLASRRTRTLAAVRGTSLDWAPQDVSSPVCTPTAGSVAVVETPAVSITEAGTTDGSASGVLQACLRSVGEVRTLGASSELGQASTATAVDSDEVALATAQAAYLGPGYTTRVSATIADLRTGVLRTGLASEGCGEPAQPGGGGVFGRWVEPNTCSQTIDDLVLYNGMLAMHVTSSPLTDPTNPTAEPCCGLPVEEVLSSDANGTEVQDEVPDETAGPIVLSPGQPPPAPPIFICGLAISGNILTWDDAGTPHDALLTPPRS